VESLSELIERRARDTAAKSLCLFGGSAISFADLYARVTHVAGGLAALGVRPGDRVAVMLANHPDYPVVFLALAWLGVTQVPLNVHPRGLGLEYVLAHSVARAIVADERFAPLRLGSGLLGSRALRLQDPARQLGTAVEVKRLCPSQAGPAPP